MNKSKFFLSAVFLLLCGLTSAFAQTENERLAEPNREVVLQVLIASNSTGGKTNLPPALVNVTKKLSGIYSFSTYNLAATYFGRIANNGNFEYRGMVNNFLPNQKEEMPVFSEVNLQGLRILSGVNNQPTAQFQNFRYGMRVPVTVTSYKMESGQTSSAVNYENIGLSIQRFGVPENAPTVIGTMTLPKTEETVFLVLTVNSNIN